MKQSCPRNVCTEQWKKLPNLIAFLEIYLYLKNNDSVKHVLRVLLNVLFIYFSLCKFAIQSTQICQLPHLQCHQTYLPCTFFSSNIICFGQRSQLKSKIFIFSSAQVKIPQIPDVNFSWNFASFFIVMTHNSFVNLKLIHFLLGKGSYRSPNFDTFKCSGENLPNFSYLFSNHWSVFLQNLHNSSVSWKITPLYFCSSNNIYFGHKEPIKTQIF